MPNNDTWESIGRELAELPYDPTVGQYGITWRCRVCQQKGQHNEDCLMLRAVRLAAEPEGLPERPVFSLLGSTAAEGS